jgi:hypothetical protein
MQEAAFFMAKKCPAEGKQGMVFSREQRVLLWLCGGQKNSAPQKPETVLVSGSVCP